MWKTYDCSMLTSGSLLSGISSSGGCSPGLINSCKIQTDMINHLIWHNVWTWLHYPLKDRLQSLLRIQSAHNKCGPHCPNFAFLKTFLNWNARLYSIRSIANPKSVRYSVSLIKFYKYIKYSSSKCNKAFVYISDCNLPLIMILR